MSEPPVDVLVTPDPEFESERGEWLVTCPACLRVVFGEDLDEAMNAWSDHDEREHPTLPEPELFGTELLEALVDPTRPEGVWAVWAVRTYWGSGRFTGAQFDRLGLDERGQDPEPDRINATDIVAVSMLDVNVPAATAIDLLGPSAHEVELVLGRVPRGPLHQVPRDEVMAGSAAVDLWYAVRNREQRMGPTKTSKLLARKRPHLLPVFDRRVQARLDYKLADSWVWWWDWCSVPEHVSGVEDLRRAAGAELSLLWLQDVSLLRILDVAVWRYDKARHPKRRSKPSPDDDD